MPSFCVFAKIVCTEFIWVSYSANPSFTGSIVIAETSFLPAAIAALVIFIKAVIPTTSSAENLALTVSIPLVIPSNRTLFAASPIFSSPLEAPDKFKLLLSLSRVDMLVCTFFSKFALSNRISTTRSSTVLLIS